MKKYLIAYYSRTGATRRAAERLYGLLGGEGLCDIEEIIDLKGRRGFIGAISSVMDSASDNITQIEAVRKAPSGYLEVIILTPVWGGKMSDAVRTYLAAFKTDIRSLSLVTCANRSKGEQIQKDILRRFAIKSKKLVSLNRKEVLRGNIDEKLLSLASEENDNNCNESNISAEEKKNETKS